MKLPDTFLQAKPLREEKMTIRGKTYSVNYVPVKLMKHHQVNGYAYKGKVYISEALSGSVKRFVIKHEVYHLNDRQKWFGYFGLELRANIITGLRDPAGFLMTAFNSIKEGRIRVYLTRFRQG